MAVGLMDMAHGNAFAAFRAEYARLGERDRELFDQSFADRFGLMFFASWKAW
jgi:hypothetical protein